MYYFIFLILLCINYIYGEELLNTCVPVIGTDYCVTLENENCGLSASLKAGDNQIFNQNFDNTISPKICQTVGLCNVCVELADVISTGNDTSGCADLTVDCGLVVTTNRLGCFNNSELVRCAATACVNDCSNNGNCTSEGCDCDFGWSGSACTDSQSLFKQCITLVENVTAPICVEFLFSGCDITLEVFVNQGNLRANALQQTFEITQIKRSFQDSICVNAAGCDVCINLKNWNLTETSASGCPEVTVNCLATDFGPFELDCFTDREILPDCFHGCNSAKDCSDHGTCEYNLYCSCFDGWQGDDCSAVDTATKAVTDDNQVTDDCPNDCSGHGTCYFSVCQCDIGYLGVDCSSGGDGNSTVLLIVILTLVLLTVGVVIAVVLYKKKPQNSFEPFETEMK